MLLGEECTKFDKCKGAKGYKAEDSRYFKDLDDVTVEMPAIGVYDRTDFDL